MVTFPGYIFKVMIKCLCIISQMIKFIVKGQEAERPETQVSHLRLPLRTESRLLSLGVFSNSFGLPVCGQSEEFCFKLVKFFERKQRRGFSTHL